MTNAESKKNKRGSTSEGAFTLIEILVGLTIIGMLFSFGYVSFRDFSRRQSLAGASKAIVGDLRLTQTNALSGIKPENIMCNSPNRLSSYSITFVSTTEYRIDARCSGGNVVVKNVTVPSDVTITIPAVNPIIYKVLGHGNNIPSGSSVNIVLTQLGTGKVQTIVVDSGGQII